jgi:hypothetical protein
VSAAGAVWVPARSLGFGVSVIGPILAVAVGAEWTSERVDEPAVAHSVPAGSLIAG